MKQNTIEELKTHENLKEKNNSYGSDESPTKLKEQVKASEAKASEAKG